MDLQICRTDITPIVASTRGTCRQRPILLYSPRYDTRTFAPSELYPPQVFYPYRQFPSPHDASQQLQPRPTTAVNSDASSYTPSPAQPGTLGRRLQRSQKPPFLYIALYTLGIECSRMKQATLDGITMEYVRRQELSLGGRGFASN